MSATDDAALLRRLRALWEEADPVPADLADEALAAVEAAGLEAEWALLDAVGLPGGLVGARGDDDVRTLQFSDGVHDVLLRVAALAPGATGAVGAVGVAGPAPAPRRVDGWVAPARPGQVVLRRGDDELRAEVDRHGRFALARVPAGPASLWFEPADTPAPEDADAARPLGWRTPAFEV
ncbi:hypothetical protein [Cellulomonas marina]|uniref:Carboxypeptidase regulatory-like domain-containing protein n=1 Tax=Cellulomonas marina TaxID=988821 RepID=A0A1I0WS26_9CELL|nr:hypothetical protein [Cellulomonas marina]GIG27812.1 hypothetical protein Cma02nite_04120 [Cellulomonas marina]SFA90960.1 hypothetical protein SAMN05421867_103161 [Cellulomonas marina]